jgi:hypothetical protein
MEPQKYIVLSANFAKEENMIKIIAKRNLANQIHRKYWKLEEEIQS